MRVFPKTKRWIACSLVLLLVLTLLPIPTAGAAQNGMIRVYLSSMGSQSSVAIKLDGVYGLPARSDIALQSGKSVVVSLSGGRLQINTGSGTVDMGSSFTIKQYENTAGRNLMTLYNQRYGTVSYLGDMEFRAVGGGINMYSILHVEDYLMGVVPYEMSNSFPIEALKAQSVAARSYAVKRMTGSGTYDVVDTTADQVYKGYASRDNIAHQAIRGTEGVVIMYNGVVADTFYGASNGGQTELPVNRLSITSTHNVGCYAMVDDPYDLRNPESNISAVSFTPTGSFTSAGLERVVREAAGAKLGGSSGLVINSIANPQLTNPRAIDPASIGVSRFFRTLTMTVGTNRGTADIALDLEQVVAPACASDLELFTLETGAGNYILTGRRYGHGVGLSQRGAEQMGKEGMDFHFILSFYYPGGQQTQLDLTRDPVTPRPSGGGAPPVSDGGASIGAVGVGLVTLSSASSTLTMRQNASSSGARVASIPHGTTVNVYGIEGDWVYIAYDGKTGYVASRYIVVTMTPTAAAPSATPTPSEPIVAYGNIVLQDDSAIRIRSGPDTLNTEIMGYVPKGALVGIMGVSGEWYRIAYEGLVGYLMQQYVAINSSYTPPPVVQTPTPTVVTPPPAAVPIGTKTANAATGVYAGEGRYYTKRADIPRGATVEIMKEDAYWCAVRYNGVEGYTPTESLGTASSGSGAAATSTPRRSSSSGSSSSRSATIKTGTSGASVTVRAKASSSSERLGSVKDGTKITVLEKGSSYSRIKAGNITGYVSNSYIR